MINKKISKKVEIGGTFEIRINNNADKTYLYNYIYKYKHWQNIITLLVTDLFKKDFNNYFKALKDWKINPHKYRGMPQMPKPRKLSELTNYSIPLDNSNAMEMF